LIVFLALPAVQRAQRDSERKQDLAEVVAAIQSWRANNEGQALDTPAEVTVLRNTYLNNNYDPTTGLHYAVSLLSIGASHVDTPPPLGTIVYQVGHICADPSTGYYTADSPAFSATVRQFAVLLTLETGGVFCLDLE
jgi:hypothetical protein